METRVAILERMSALADGVRGRMLLLLEDHELTVNELGSVMQLPQSTTSRQLKTLASAGWVVSRPEGPSRLYSMADEGDPAADRELWRLTRDELASTPAAEEDRRRLQPVLAGRRDRSRAYFESDAAQWDLTRDELFGKRFSLLALLGLLPEGAVWGDLGCGSGALSELIAPVAKRVVAVDDSPAMLAEARERLARFDHVEVRRGAVERLPLGDDSLDLATLALVLHHLPHPDGAVREAARVLRAGGRLLLVDMLPHDRQEYRRTMGHVWMGFSRDRIEKMLAENGFRQSRFLELPVDPAAKGPSLFAVTASWNS